MIAYRLGQLPDLERHKEQEQLPQGPRLSRREAEQVSLPDGTRFGEASVEQVVAWLEHVCRQAGVTARLLADVLNGLDLTAWDDRWYALNELLEFGTIRDVFEGKVCPKHEIRPQQGGMSRAELEDLLEEYGLRVALSRKSTGVGSVYAQRNVPTHAKIYVGTLSALEEGGLLRENVREKLERKCAEWNQEAA